MEIDLAMRVVASGHVLYRELDGEGVLLNLTTERYFGLDEVGTHFWKVLLESPSIEHACQALCTEYEVECVVLEQDLKELVQRLVEHGLVELRAG